MKEKTHDLKGWASEMQAYRLLIKMRIYEKRHMSLKNTA